MNLKYETKLAATSRRKPRNEAKLLWLILGVPLFYILFFGFETFRTGIFGIHPFGFCGLVAGGIAYIYYRYTQKIVLNAAVEYNKLLRQKQKRLDDERILNYRQQHETQHEKG